MQFIHAANYLTIPSESSWRLCLGAELLFLIWFFGFLWLSVHVTFFVWLGCSFSILDFSLLYLNIFSLQFSQKKKKNYSNYKWLIDDKRLKILKPTFLNYKCNTCTRNVCLHIPCTTKITARAAALCFFILFYFCLLNETNTRKLFKVGVEWWSKKAMKTKASPRCFFIFFKLQSPTP